jgi:hypothetical protein
MERRTVDVDVQLGATGGLVGQRAGGAPDVLADADAHLHPTDHVQLVRVAGVAGREVALFVEHRVVRQQALAVGAQHLAARAHRSRGVEIAIGGDIAHHRGTAPGVGGHLGERSEVVGDETRLQHEILRRVAGDGQLGEGDDVAPGCLGLVVRGADARDIAVEIADLRVDLGECDAQPGHPVRLASGLAHTVRTGSSP